MNPVPAETVKQRLPRRAVRAALNRHAGAELDAACKPGGGWDMQGQVLDRGWIFRQQVRDGPIAEHILPEGEAVAAEIAQAFACNQLIQSPGRLSGRIERSRASERLPRKRPEDSRSVAMVSVAHTVRCLPPLYGHLDFRARCRLGGGPSGQAS